MYKMTVKENFKNPDFYDIQKKEFVTLVEASEAYADFFPLAKSLIVSFCECLIEGNAHYAPVFQQIIDAINALEVNEEIEMNATDATFLACGENFLEFNLIGRHLSVKVEEI